MKRVRKYRKILGSPDDEFIVFKAEPQKPKSKRGRKKKIVSLEKEEQRKSDEEYEAEERELKE